jgi:4-oxalocrotonate tautomerase
MPMIRVSMWTGRSLDQKRQIVEAFTRDMEKIVGSKPESVHVIFEDVQKENWGHAGHLCSDK